VSLNQSRPVSFNNWIKTLAAKKLAVWLVLSLAISVIFFQDFWAALPHLLSPDYILKWHASPWGILGLCVIFLIIKRKEVNLEAGFTIKSFRTNLSCTILSSLIGIGLITGAVLIPSSDDNLIFSVLLSTLGVFVVIFGKGARIPVILLVIYGFGVFFPIAIEHLASEAYAKLALTPLIAVMHVFNLPIVNQGHLISFTSAGGEPISVVLTTACAGPATMAVFICLFALMMLDMPLPERKAIWLFIGGVIGTWFQSFIRLVIIILLGYYVGSDALWTAHYWTIYILFPLWYLLFAFIYFKYHEKIKRISYSQAGI
jgi:exosortase/archaeosortase family protein